MTLRVMILGGTTEARQLAEGLVEQGIDVVISLAGATERPAPLPGTLRRGGFGGAEGLAAALTDESIGALVDATHPFAETITGNAVEAAAVAGCPLLLLRRPPWSEPAGGGWRHYPSLSAAVAALPAGARVLMATGSGSARLLTQRADVNFVLRSIEPVQDLASNATSVLARPPFTSEAERALLQSRGITHLVTKNSGGESGRAKLEAAADLGVPVLMVDRPPAPHGVATAATIAAALAWLRAQDLLDTHSDAAP